MPSSTARPLRPAAALLAWVFPGLGHISLGERRRGALIMGGVLFLFVGGILIGGLDAVDRKRDPLWFYAQVFCGPIAFLADAGNQALVRRPPEGWRSDPEWRQRYRQRDPHVLAQLRGTGLGKVNEIGTLYVALAGLMNLVVILDALHRPSEGRMSTTVLVAYVPLLEPINALQAVWYLLIVPLALGISVIYKAMRMPRLDGFWRQVALMTIQIILAMIALGVCLIVLVQGLIPLIPA